MAESFTNSSGSILVAHRGQDASPMLLPKHKIFLSHSGAQKPFVEQLCVELENSGYAPFFDQRPDSLPKGETFPELILDAAKQCLVAVVVLSREFLTSKWCMLELVAFTEAQRSSNPNLKVLPLFYKLGVSELKDRQMHDETMNLARNLAASDPRVEPMQWEYALKVLERTNGEVFSHFGGSEIAYRSIVVATICRICEPDVQFELAGMKGRDRMCKILAEEFEKQTQNDGGHPATLGVYGMGGTGKTHLCMALCNYFHAEYAGRVCYVEFESGESVLKLQKAILEKLSNANEGLLHRITTIQQANGRLQEMLPRVDVFLAVDNVHDGDTKSLDAIRLLLKVISPGSKAIVTSRSKDVLKAILRSSAVSSFLHIPALEEEEAMHIFLQRALPSRSRSSFTLAEVQILEGYVDRCFFLQDFVQKRYHPLALEALGSYLNGLDSKEPANWVEKSNFCESTSDIFYKDPVFKILKTGYDALQTQSHRLLFFDLAIFAPREKLKDVNDLCRWLEAMHNSSQASVMWDLVNLNMKALIEIGKSTSDDFSCVFVHELYKELAEHEIKQDATSRWCVYERGGKSLPWCLESNPKGPHWKNLVRVKLQTPHPITLPKEKVQEWANLQVLCLHTDGLKHLDIRPLKQLRNLEVLSMNLKTLLGTKNLEHLQWVELKCPALRIDELKFSNCGTLEAFHLTGVHPPSRSSHNFKSWAQCVRSIPKRMMLDFQNSILIQKLVIEGDNSLNQSLEEQWKFGITGLGSLTNLRDLRLWGLPVRSLPGLEKLIHVEVLYLQGCDQHKVVLPDLSPCSNLKWLNVYGSRISEIPGLDKLRSLFWFVCDSCEELALPDLRSLEKLEVLISSSNPSNNLVPKSCLQTTWPRMRNFYMTLIKESMPEVNPASLSHYYNLELLTIMPSWQREWIAQNFKLESTWTRYNLYAGEAEAMTPRR